MYAYMCVGVGVGVGVGVRVAAITNARATHSGHRRKGVASL